MICVAVGVTTESGAVVAVGREADVGKMLVGAGAEVAVGSGAEVGAEVADGTGVLEGTGVAVFTGVALQISPL